MCLNGILKKQNSRQRGTESKSIKSYHPKFELLCSPKFYKPSIVFSKAVSAIQKIMPSYDEPVRKMYRKDDLSLSLSESYKYTQVFKSSDKEATKSILMARGYILDRQVGRGGYAVVYKVHYKSMVLACKVINMIRANPARLIKHLKLEIFIMERHPHPNIITIMDHFIVNSSCFIIMEFADGGSLGHYIEKNGILSEELTHFFFIQIIKGLFYLHSVNIAHRDLKLDNILLVRTANHPIKKFILKLTDFGLAQLVYRPTESKVQTGNFAGTMNYLAPEIVRLQAYSEFRQESNMEFNPFKSDIWALGICLYEMITGHTPFEAYNSFRLLYKAQMSKQLSFPRGSKYSEKLKSLISSLLEPDPDKRLDPCGIAFDPWVQEYLNTYEKQQLQDELTFNKDFLKVIQNQLNVLSSKSIEKNLKM